MLRNEAIRNAADVLHFRSHITAVLENLEIGHGSAWKFWLEQNHHHRGEEVRMDSNQGCHQGIHISIIISSLISTKSNKLIVKVSAKDKNIDVSEVIYLDDYAPAQVPTINKIARNSYQNTRSKFPYTIQTMASYHAPAFCSLVPFYGFSLPVYRPACCPCSLCQSSLRN